MKAEEFLNFYLFTFNQILISLYSYDFFFLSLTYSQGANCLSPVFLRLTSSKPAFLCISWLHHSIIPWPSCSRSGTVIPVSQIWVHKNRGISNGQWKEIASLQLFWLSHDYNAHSSTLIEEYHNILQKVLNAVMKWEHVISQCILCNRTAAIPGFKSIFILISGIRRERKPWSFFFFIWHALRST